ncbi:ty3-gypsy retrotransposon protein [Tanacetum coccineum]
MEGFRREQGMIIFRDRYYIGTQSKLKELLLSEFHNTPTEGHSGMKKMLVGLSALFYWKGMRKSVEEFIGKCLVCQQTKYSTQAPGGLLQPLPTPSRVWEDISMDFITELPIYKWLSVIFVVVDRFTKYAHFVPLLASFNASKVADFFIDMVFKLHGIPKTIVSNRIGMSGQGTGHEAVTNFPKEEHEGQPVEQPLAICATRVVLQKGVPARQVLVQWSGSSPEEATWEWLSEFKAAYPSYHLEDKVIVEGVGNVTAESGEPHDEEPTKPKDKEPTDDTNKSRPMRAASRPVWFKDYVNG